MKLFWCRPHLQDYKLTPLAPCPAEDSVRDNVVHSVNPPEYLVALTITYAPPRSLTSLLETEPLVRLHQSQTRSLSQAQSIDCFKGALNTYLFSQSYTLWAAYKLKIMLRTTNK